MGITCSQQPLGDQVPALGGGRDAAGAGIRPRGRRRRLPAQTRQGWEVICEPELAARVFSFSRALRCRVHSQEICS